MEFDEHAQELLERLAPPVDHASERWADVLTRARRSPRWRPSMPRGRSGVLALAGVMVMTAAAAQAAGIPRFAVSYFTESRGVPDSVRASFERVAPNVRADQIQLLARFTTSRGTFAYYAAPGPGGGFCNMVVGLPPNATCLSPREVPYFIQSEGDSETDAWVISGQVPPQTTRVDLTYADGITEPAHTGGGWFVIVVTPTHQRNGYQPTRITVRGAGGTAIHTANLPTRCFVSPASLAPPGTSVEFVLSHHCPASAIDPGR